MEQKTLTFAQLCTDELYSLLRLRSEVFVVEQNCVYQDIDDLDRHPETLHNLFYREQNLVAYVRILAPGVVYDDYACLGRIVIAPSSRGDGLGYDIVKQSIRIALAHWPNNSIKISAQAYLLNFYNKLGFKQVSDIYLEDDIEHVSMILEDCLQP
ncbi:MAG: GNAT family N-acetyltransferase [Aestuariibacter sp.]